MGGLDRISDLPESLLAEILSHLPTKVSVKTSLMSKRWGSLWRRVPGLEVTLDDFRGDGQAMDSFVNKFLESNKDSRMKKFKIQSMQCNNDRLMEWIDTAVAHGVQELYVETTNALYPTQESFEINTLISLKLMCVGLKIMHMEDVWYEYDPLIVEKIISSCQTLEDLTMISRKTMPAGLFSTIDEKNTCVRSQTLKRFRLIFENTWGGTNFYVEIDAPRLEYLCIRDYQSDRIVVKNLSSLSMVDIDTNFSVTLEIDMIFSNKRDTIKDFFAGISGVKYMIISHATLEVFYLYSEYVKIPKFNNLLLF
ncbi:unnamed protein product [Microthlaspi erraticum]|uniref:F-box domain-containing protein n=1 Tax=Microthlaspi erraticum TaxID=1685480 RepID=A0A6D2IVL6_9BRAS|nr:unnamed protein product [Microthlaspi erraticum]CAA7034392.1 unnamed protein product [Microthlaspi erraticum]